MRKVYRCAGCGAQLPDPVYVRLQLIRCGVVNARANRDRQKTVKLGHFCPGCLKGCVALGAQTMLGPDADLRGLAGLLSP